MTVPELLAQSRASHDAYRRLGNKHPKPSGWQAFLWDALSLRIRAHALDPNHLQPAWSADKVSHGELVAFYQRQLGLTVI